MTERDYEIFAAVVPAYRFVVNLLTQKKVTIARLKKLVFGARTETTEAVLGRGAEGAASEPARDASRGEPSADPPASGSRPKRRKGHGRLGAEAYTGVERICVPHESLEPGDDCPHCQQGRVSEMAQPALVIRLVGQAPVHGKRYERQGDVLYQDDTRNRILDLMGKRLAKAQAQNAALATGSKTDGESESQSDPGGGGESNADGEGESKTAGDPKRRAIVTSGIVSTCAGRRIALFFTGRQHAGENLRDVLAQRAKELGPPIHMCDPLALNMPADLNTILANCLAHGRRKFADVAEYFHDQCRYVLKALKVVYENDAVARKEQLSPEARLQFHQTHSSPVMKELHAWLTRQIEEHLVEPNSGLGEAINYLLKRWDKFTLFLRQAGAPLDNNLCERALKKVILHRKNAMFYKTENGAHVADVSMSLIYTCELCGANPFDYLTELQRHAAEVAAQPACWMPWNYRDALALVPATTGPPTTATIDSLATVP